MVSILSSILLKLPQLILELNKSCSSYYTIMTKNDRNVILVTGAAGNMGTELVKQLSTVGAIFIAGVHLSNSFSRRQLQ
ncbi:MAG: hypothetical protein ACXWFC_02070 [Nitrososphaeraceae archaeon]